MVRFAQAVLLIAAAQAAAATLPPERAEFFEKKIRPVLAGECHECHGAEKQKGGLRLDYRAGWQKGGDTGAAIVAGDPARSLLLRTIRHEEPDLEMPSKRPKLTKEVIADFEQWIAMGAPDPRDEPAKAGEKVAWNTLLADRKKWWSLQPIQKPEVPLVKDSAWSRDPVDQFLLAKMEAAGLAPGPDADARALCRRLSYIVTGLPPKVEELEAFVGEHEAETRETGRGQKTVERFVDRLLGTPQFGERWARRWMDLVRYAETHGSEGDPEIPYAWRYRDYLIRALNEDVPWNDLIREHLAGDLLPKPRWNTAEGINESILGIAHLRLVEHGFQPVDTRDEQVKVVENQIDVLGKAFQGMTFACARCHDHKFDAVSQRDYYALAGVFESSRPGIVTIDSPEVLNRNHDEMAALKVKIKKALAEAWVAESERIPERLLNLNALDLELAKARQRVASLEQQLARLDNAARGRVLEKRGLAQSGKASPMPIARWDFESSTAQIAKLDGNIEGDAELSGGKLKLRGKGYFQTAPLGRPLREKTLEAWVSLATADQAGGGVFTIEDSRGDVFDSIVFAEKDPRLWVAGSDFFKRSQRLNGPEQTAGELVHVALCFSANGETTFYRNGSPYGQSWRNAAQEPITFAPDSRVLFGLRHTGGKANGFLRGEIEEARLYDRALTGEEVRSSLAAGISLAAVSAAELADARTEEEREESAKVARALKEANADLARLAPSGKNPWLEAVAEARKDPASPLRPWIGETLATPSRPSFTPAPALEFRYGPGVTDGTCGDFTVLPEGERVVGSLLPRGTVSGLLTRKHGGIAATRWFRITTDFISVRAAGRDAQIRFMLDGYPLPNGQIFPRAFLNSDETRWTTIDVKYRKGARAYIEVATAQDQTRGEKGGDRGWFAVESIIMHDGPAPTDGAPVIADFTAAASPQERAIAFGRAVRDAAKAWRDGGLKEGQRALLDFLIRKNLLPADEGMPSLKAEVAAFRKLEADVPIPRRATGVVEADSADAAFLQRGDPHKPDGVVPRAYLGVLNSTPFARANSGRLQLAEALVDPGNPLTSRVMANRLWQWVFGRGLVATSDNFGKMGEVPSHPELLDYLASRFVEEGWSAKKVLRHLLTTHAFQLSTNQNPSAGDRDAENRLLSYFPLRRLEAEAIRDSLIVLSGKLDSTLYGTPVSGNQPRRSIYVNVRRTNLDPFLQTFDAPKPFTTIGRRDSTNVPAQSLALLNDPFVKRAAEQWAANILKEAPSKTERVSAMFLAALGRPPTLEEVKLCDSLRSSDPARSERDAIQELAQAIFNLKEFVYLR